MLVSSNQYIDLKVSPSLFNREGKLNFFNVTANSIGNQHIMEQGEDADADDDDVDEILAHKDFNSADCDDESYEVKLKIAKQSTFKNGALATSGCLAGCAKRQTGSCGTCKHVRLQC